MFWGVLWCPGSPVSEDERGDSRNAFDEKLKCCLCCCKNDKATTIYLNFPLETAEREVMKTIL